MINNKINNKKMMMKNPFIQHFHVIKVLKVIMANRLK